MNLRHQSFTVIFAVWAIPRTFCWSVSNTDWVHLSFKANILIDDTGRACLADYGLPFILDIPLWSDFKAIGPCRWTAPEVMDPPDDEPVSRLLYTPSSDVYSFGMAMLEVRHEFHISDRWSYLSDQILTGKAPFEKKDHDLKVYTFVAAGKRPDIPSFLPINIGSLIQKCWAQNPTHRPSAREVSQTLNSVRELTVVWSI